MSKLDSIIILISIFIFIIAGIVLFTISSRMTTNTPSVPVETRQPIVQWTSRLSILDPFTGQTEGVSEVDLARLVPDPCVVFTEPLEVDYTKDEANRYEILVDNLLPGDFYTYILSCKSKGWPGNLADSEDIFWSEVEYKGVIYRLYICWIGYENDLTGCMVLDVYTL